MTRPGLTVPAVALVLLAGIACDSTDPAPTLEIGVDGRLERGLTLDLTATLDGRTLAPSEIEWTATPASAVALEPGAARLLEAGSLSFVARAGGTEADTTLEVALPPEIVFDAVADGNRDVYRAALDGRDVARLTDHAAEEEDPSAAGGTVAFTSWRAGNADPWSVPAAGGAPSLLDAAATGEHERQVALSDDGARLAFVRSESGFPRAYTASADGSGASAVTEGTGIAGGIEASPAWAPDGGRIALMSTVAGDADLYVVDPATGEVTELAGGDGPQVEPAWSPDGARIAYVAAADGDADLFVVELETGSVTRLTDRAGTDGQPAYLADGRIVYTAWTAEGPELRWLDPAELGESHAIPLELDDPGNPAPLEP